MRYFIDTEFSERGPKYPIQLISIGIVSEDGREFYAISNEFDAESCDEWVKENVLPFIYIQTAGAYAIHNLQRISELLIDFIGSDKPEFWGYYADYDWVVFCQIFGTMLDLPGRWPIYCNDIKQLIKEMGNPELPKQDSKEHNALNDARWNRETMRFLEKLGA